MKNKLLNKVISVFLMFLFIITITSCGATSPDYGPSYDSSSSEKDDFPNDFEDNFEYQAGQLTSCAYNDNDHFTFWKELMSSNQEGEGIFKNYYEKYSFKAFNRLKVKVPINISVKVHLLDENQNIVFTGIPDATGNTYLYPKTYQETYNICLEYVKVNEEEPTMQYEVISSDTEFIIEATNKIQDSIQLMFVIDTTGSMGDEMGYLNAEIIDIIEQVKNEFPSSVIELAIMLYRDKSDDYVTKYSDFTTNISAQQEFLSKQRAGGGGDFEEAVDVALEEASQKQWSKNAKTKILVHVADAPAHDEEVNKWNKATIDLASKGVRIISVASSGINKKTEYFFRCQSILTNGTYVYLTNDSGIGNDHLEATVEQKPIVEYLNASLVRLIKGYHTGVFEEPVYYRQQK